MAPIVQDGFGHDRCGEFAICGTAVCFKSLNSFVVSDFDGSSPSQNRAHPSSIEESLRVVLGWTSYSVNTQGTLP